MYVTGTFYPLSNSSLSYLLDRILVTCLLANSVRVGKQADSLMNLMRNLCRNCTNRLRLSWRLTPSRRG
ncbi:Uncharacterised protein [Mycobacteroides abscessus subsp. abscessus]|nr:Uncharacterised protein [Mycobacteroides abscessus subsp. abscessus]